MAVLEIAVALVGVLCLVFNHAVDAAVDKFVASRRRLPSPPTGVVLDERTNFVVGADDWGDVVFWSFVREDEAQSTLAELRLRRALFKAERGGGEGQEGQETQEGQEGQETQEAQEGQETQEGKEGGKGREILGWSEVARVGQNRRAQRLIREALDARTSAARASAARARPKDELVRRTSDE